MTIRHMGVSTSFHAKGGFSAAMRRKLAWCGRQVLRRRTSAWSPREGTARCVCPPRIGLTDPTAPSVAARRHLRGVSWHYFDNVLKVCAARAAKIRSSIHPSSQPSDCMCRFPCRDRRAHVAARRPRHTVEGLIAIEHCRRQAGRRVDGLFAVDRDALRKRARVRYSARPRCAACFSPYPRRRPRRGD